MVELDGKQNEIVNIYFAEVGYFVIVLNVFSGEEQFYSFQIVILEIPFAETLHYQFCIIGEDDFGYILFSHLPLNLLNVFKKNVKELQVRGADLVLRDLRDGFFDFEVV